MNFKKFTNKYKDHFEWLDKKLKYIILIPTIIGGLWQLFELATISTSYIRFFSLSQVIPDGLLWLFVLLILYSAFRFFRAKFKLENLALKPPKEKGIKRLLIAIISFTVLAAGIVYMLIMSLIPLYRSLNYNVSFLELVMFLLLFFTLFYFALSALSNITNLVFDYTSLGDKARKWYDKKDQENDIKLENKVSSNLTIFVSLVIFLFVFKFLIVPILAYSGKVKSEFILPKNLKNLNYINCKVIESYGEKMDYEILYINDLYMFIKITTAQEEHDILVMKFEELFENHNCE